MNQKASGSMRPSLYGADKTGEVISLSVVGAASGNERAITTVRPILGGRFYGGMVVGMCLVGITGVLWMENSERHLPMVATAPERAAPVAAQAKAAPGPSPAVREKTVAMLESTPLAAEPPAPLVEKSAPRIEPLAVKHTPAAVPAPRRVETKPRVTPKAALVATSSSKPARPARKKHDPDVDFMEAVIARIGQK